MSAMNEPDEQVVEPAAKRKPGNSGATIYDIAKLAGVNPSTVSRALTTPGRINERTEAKIRAAAAELNYRVNPFARALPTGRTKMLAVMVANITNPVFFDVVRGAQEAATLAGYTLVIADSEESAELEAIAANKIMPVVDGIALVTSRLTDEQISALHAEKPVVTMNRVIDGVSSTIPDSVPGVNQLIELLQSFGHRSIAYLSGPASAWTNKHRWELLLDAAVAAGMNIVEIGPNSPNLEAGKAALARVRASGVTAVVAYNDLMAIGLLREAVAQGVSIPGDLSIAGFDDIFGADFTSPGTTTVKTPLLELGRIVVNRLIAEIEDPEAQAVNAATGLDTVLVVRGSTGPAKVGN
jgi:LacI family transcriptional regulator